METIINLKREKRLEYKRQYYQDHIDDMRKKGREYSKQNYELNKEAKLAKVNAYNHKMKENSMKYEAMIRIANT